MSSFIRSRIDRLNREIAALRNRVADEVRKEADATSKINRAGDRARRASSPGLQSMALREVERAQADLERATRSRAQHEKTIATKTQELLREQTNLARAEEAERKKQDQISRRAEEAREKRVRELEKQLNAQRTATIGKFVPTEANPGMTEYDCFISHASEDKDGFVRALAAALQSRGVRIFYDEITIQWGDSLRRRIDEGLSRSKFGVVVLSEAFFRKKWPQHELDGLVQMEMAGRSRILPIWHKVSKDEVASFSPTLADKVAVNTADFSADEIADQLVRLIG